MEDKLKVTLNEYLPLRDIVFNTLRQAILKGELEPGERLMEIQLADRLGVSRTPIREAIRKLELEGLVVMIPRKGAEVARITEKDLNDVLEVRCSLEELAVELACEKITKEELEALRKSMDDFKAAIHEKDVTISAEKDVTFHDIIFQATRNDRLIQILNNLREQMYRYRVEYLKDLESHAILVNEHQEIYDSIEKKDVEKAKESIKKHIYNQVVGVSKTIKYER
ncbi:GntR family transcriptional regulator [Anaeromicropila herbilytica]|uniref:GntR family transcriptional regulator n=1 Tax=Anaeromicropila herbilytica TaxID=2785025 RepID=A0A7R7EHA2_9FIRM|nr:GntR family transcriptional regulator [Anaeromicropila herbilytica]BCN28811.1 GntR family transcriptional regulator [Anaeromicropila herbilytica]